MCLTTKSWYRQSRGMLLLNWDEVTILVNSFLMSSVSLNKIFALIKNESRGFLRTGGPDEIKKKKCKVTIWLNTVRWHVSMWSGAGLLLLAGQCTCRPGHEENFVHEASSWQNLTCNSFQAKHGLDTSELNTAVVRVHAPRAGCLEMCLLYVQMSRFNKGERIRHPAPPSPFRPSPACCVILYTNIKEKTEKKKNLLYWNTWRMARS